VQNQASRQWFVVAAAAALRKRRKQKAFLSNDFW
jgi:hypothetical protein